MKLHIVMLFDSLALMSLLFCFIFWTAFLILGCVTWLRNRWQKFLLNG